MPLYLICIQLILFLLVLLHQTKIRLKGTTAEISILHKDVWSLYQFYYKYSLPVKPGLTLNIRFRLAVLIHRSAETDLRPDMQALALVFILFGEF